MRALRVRSLPELEEAGPINRFPLIRQPVVVTNYKVSFVASVSSAVYAVQNNDGYSIMQSVLCFSLSIYKREILEQVSE